MKILEIDDDKITNLAKEKAKTPAECWYMYETYLKPYVFKVGILYGFVAGLVIGIIIVLTVMKYFNWI